MIFKAQITNIEFFASGLQSCSDNDFKKLLKMKEGDYIEVETWKERNINFHKKYFALMNCTINHLPESFDVEFKSLDNLRKYVTICTGRFDLLPSLKGQPIPVAHSISFKNMDEAEFSDLYSDSLNVILKHFLKDISKEDFENDILNFL
ncbi:MAG: DUF1367 family protein [Lutibacter sp.]|jgi:hypothetical protein